MQKVKLNKTILTTIALICALIMTSSGLAQQSSEQFIPIGQSPGISGKTSFIGKIIEVDPTTQSLVVENNNGRKNVKVTDSTRFWLDRSGVKQSNQLGDFRDCEVGDKIEIKFTGEEQDIADWIKIEST